MKYAIITFGCRVNQADSLELEEALRERGAVATGPDDADVVVVNTCSVTAASDQGARQTIRRVARGNPGARIVVTGCYATRRPDEVQSLPHVARVFSNDGKSTLVATLADDFRQTTAERFGEGDGACGAAIEPGMAGRTAFTLRVQNGCAEPCVYCIIPATRGRPRSVPLDELSRQVERVAAAGFKEIALTGVHLGSYGRDLTPPTSLVALLERLTEGPAVRFRISSLEPMDCVPAVVDIVAGSERFAPHFHLPLQHASRRVLAAMRRPYTADHYARLVERIRERLPEASIGTDIIVGFPGETGEDVEELVAVLDALPLSHLHVFPYSDRPGTVAAAMGGKVPGSVVRARALRVREIGQRLTAQFRASQLGTVHRALTLEDGTLAVTGNYLKVRIPPGRGRNEWVTVRVTGADQIMTAEIVSQPIS